MLWKVPRGRFPHSDVGPKRVAFRAGGPEAPSRTSHPEQSSAAVQGWEAQGRGRSVRYRNRHEQRHGVVKERRVFSC